MKASKAYLDEMEKEETLDPWEQKANRAFKVCQVCLVTRENAVTKEPLDLKEIEVPLGLLVTTVLLVCQECQVKWELEAFLDPEDLQDCLGHQAFLAPKEVRVQRAMRDRRVPQEHLAKSAVKVQ